MTSEEVEETFLFWHQGSKPAQHECLAQTKSLEQGCVRNDIGSKRWHVSATAVNASREFQFNLDQMHELGVLRDIDAGASGTGACAQRASTKPVAWPRLAPRAPRTMSSEIVTEVGAPLLVNVA